MKFRRIIVPAPIKIGNIIVEANHDLFLLEQEFPTDLIKFSKQSGNDIADQIENMHKDGTLTDFLVEIEAMSGLKQNPDNHPEGDVFEHTMAALRSVNSTDPKVNLGILFHDIGKTGKGIQDNDTLSYHGHDKAGVLLFLDIADRFKLPRDIIESVSFSIENHMKIRYFPIMKKLKVYKFIFNKNWGTLWKVSIADTLSRGFGQEEVEEMTEFVKEFKQKYKNYYIDQYNGLVKK